MNETNSQHSKSATEWYDEGIEHIKSKKYNEALNCFLKVIELDSKYPKIWFQLAFVNSHLYNKEKAVEYYNKANEQDPSDYEAWYNLGNEYLEDRRDPFINDPWEEESGDYEGAIKCYEKAVEINPKFSYAWNNMGFAYSKLGNHTKALKYHAKAVELDSENINAWVNLGCEYYFLNKHEKAIETYEKAIEVDPSYNMVWVCLRTTVESYKLKNKLSAENKGMWVKISKVYITLNKILEAIECLKQVIELDPSFFEAWHQLGIAYNRINNHEKFVECFLKPSDVLKQIKKISIITTSQGPIFPDVFWLLQGNNGISVVPSEGPDENFLSQIQSLPNFNNEMVIKAMTSTDDNTFVVWESI